MGGPERGAVGENWEDNSVEHPSPSGEVDASDRVAQDV